MDRFLGEFSILADWFRQFLYDISEPFLDREWVLYEDHTENVWFGIIYTVIFLAIIPFLTDLIFTFILSVRSRKLIFGHSLLLQRFGLYQTRNNNLKYGNVSSLKEYRGFKPDNKSINTPKVFALSSSSANKPILYSIQTVNNSDIKYHNLGYTAPQFKDITSHNLRNTGLDNVSVSNRPFVTDLKHKVVKSDIKYSSVNQNINYSPINNRDIRTRIYDNRNKHITIKDSPMFNEFLGKFRLLQRLNGRTGGKKDDSDD